MLSHLFVLDEQRKKATKNRDLLSGSRGSRTPDPLLVRQTL